MRITTHKELNIKHKELLNYTISLEKNQIYSPNHPQYSGVIEFDFAKATNLSTKSEGNQLKIEYINAGKLIDEYFTVYVLDISLSSNIKNTYTSESIPPKFDVTVRGADDCKLYITLNDEPINGRDAETGDIKPLNETLKSGNPTEINLLDYTELTHGIYTINMWASTENGGIVVNTNTITSNFIYGDETNNSPIIMSNILSGSKFELYDKLVVNYNAYFKNANNTELVNISIVDSNDEPLLTTTQNIEFNNGFGNGSYTFTLFPQNGKELIGDDRKLVISIAGNQNKQETNIVIVESTVPLTQTSGYYAYFTSMGRSNNEPENERNKWVSRSDDNKYETKISFSDNVEFLNTGSGWIADKDGNMAMHLRKNRYLTVEYKPFTENPFELLVDEYDNPKQGDKHGLTISFEFATRNCLDANSTIIECLNNNIGFYATASELKLLGSNVTLGAKFKEDTRIKIDIVIEGYYTKYSYDTVLGTDPTAKDYIRRGSSNECLALIYVDGVYAGLTLVDWSKDSTKLLIKEKIVSIHKNYLLYFNLYFTR